MAKELKVRKEIKLKWGGSIVGTITLIFVLSKVFQIGICKDWGWGWVFSPIWLSILIFFGFFIGMFMVIGMIWLIVYGLESLLDHNRKSNSKDKLIPDDFSLSKFNPGKRF